MTVFRFPGPIDPAAIYKECQALVGVTQYKKCAKREDSPFLADCLTAVSHIFKKALSIDLQLDWIGNMPRKLYKNGWSVQKVRQEELKTGDLLFLGKKGKLVSHLALALNGRNLFHVAQKGAKIELLEEVFAKYVLPQDQQTLLTYIDPRSDQEFLALSAN